MTHAEVYRELERDFQYWSELMNSKAGQQFKNEVNPEPY